MSGLRINIPLASCRNSWLECANLAANWRAIRFRAGTGSRSSLDRSRSRPVDPAGFHGRDRNHLPVPGTPGAKRIGELEPALFEREDCHIRNGSLAQGAKL